MTTAEDPAQSAGRVRDAARTRAEIMDAATQEFARAGYGGARVDEIAARTRTTKRMIYYYFGGKEQLFTAVLERAYSVIREAEQQLDVEHLDPVAGIRKLAAVTFDHHEAHPDFIQLVSIENVYGAAHIAGSDELRRLSSPAIDVSGRSGTTPRGRPARAVGAPGATGRACRARRSPRTCAGSRSGRCRTR